MAAADQAAMSAHQMEQKTSTESTLATAKSMIESLVKSLDAGDVGSSMKKKVVKHEKEQAAADIETAPYKSDKEGEKAALEAKLAKLEARQNKLMSKLKTI